VLRKTAEGLEEGQAHRAMENLDVFRKIQNIIEKLRLMAGDEEDEEEEEGKNGIFPFGIILDDPAGNSYLENPMAPSQDPRMKITR